MHSGTQNSGVSFGNACDQIGCPGQGQRNRKTTDNCDNLSFQAMGLQCFVNRPLAESSLRNEDVLAAGYALFQAANNTAVMTNIRAEQRGVISGMLNLSRNLGLITGASAMGAIFALASATINFTTARPEDVATGMRFTFAIATILMVAALGIAIGTYRRTLRNRALAAVTALQVDMKK